MIGGALGADGGWTVAAALKEATESTTATMRPAAT
jgi:hypothetical protein